MWPGQQPPGGEQNPQDQNQNPYQQPGYQQPNPYQQPGYQQQGYGYPQGQSGGQPGQTGQPGYPQPNPYQQPTVPQYAVPGGPPGGPKAPDDKKKTTIVAIVAATAVVVAAAVTGYLVLGNDDGGKDVADGKKASPSAKPSETTSSPAANPRGGEDAAPTVPGWKVVTNPKWGTQFDVPGDWEVAGTGVFAGFEDVKDPTGAPAAGFSAPAYYKSKWCVDDADKDGKKEETELAGVGTKGAQGAKNTDEAATNEAANWVWAAYAQEDPKDKVKIGKAEPYTTESGLSGSVVTATATGLAKKTKCDTDGKSIAFSFKNGKGEYSTWVLFTAAGVDDELPDTTIQKILSTVRLADSTS
ncbi:MULTISPECIES: hypothetical protein [unclassified Streptomyces]|uniref:hypothetical protein n=1 Tax=unclassified Streptomyces TaxID=2593676 RepID=UPI0001C198EE|nr:MULTISPECIES: hypothetical protein [unclassified Streptomyces]AEN08634.1 conserved hypothetical protein [Streptomyces sp. SirexAA-E]MYR69564.1 hypothetical protein [Streptomyces sp. SID4939]MYS01655.1 hypothetical protein [Streptomyces sp. SID4940]MYT66221.1 hypothetical protein [Streptomyces sp. SID8357]MYT83141.1 hypothetical protein [Streptomyces sp. SID8360]